MTRAAVALLLALAACSGHAHSDPEDVHRDAEKLRAAMATDPATQALSEVDGFVQDRRPVLASQTIDSGVLPAVRHQIEELDGLTMSTPEGTRVQQQAVRAYRHREQSLVAWSHALARGEVEDAELLAAVHDQRVAEQEVVLAIDAVEVLAGGHAGKAPPHVPHLHDPEHP